MAFYNSGPIREKGHKFYVSKRVYPKSKYDNYVDGIYFIKIKKKNYVYFVIVKYRCLTIKVSETCYCTFLIS
jgi:hypothetical protein